MSFELSEFSQADLAAEASLLSYAQVQQEIAMRRSGLYDKALEHAPEMADTPSTSACVIRYSVRTTGGFLVERTGVQFTSTHINDAGHEQRRVNLVPIVEKSEGITMLRSGFDDGDASLILDLRRGLEDARDLGVLPNLESSLVDISLRS